MSPREGCKQESRGGMQAPLKNMVGTVDFMAPEILRVPRRQDFATPALYHAALSTCAGFSLPADVWAFGISVYEALCGHRPWPSRDKVCSVPGSGMRCFSGAASRRRHALLR